MCRAFFVLFCYSYYNLESLHPGEKPGDPPLPVKSLRSPSCSPSFLLVAFALVSSFAFALVNSQHHAWLTSVPLLLYAFRPLASVRSE